MQCEYFALEGLTSLLETIAGIRKSANKRLGIAGILRTMYDPRSSLTSDVSSQLHEHFGEKVLRTVIPRNVRLAEAPSHGQPILYYDRLSNSCRVRACDESSSERAVNAINGIYIHDAL